MRFYTRMLLRSLPPQICIAGLLGWMLLTAYHSIQRPKCQQLSSAPTTTASTYTLSPQMVEQLYHAAQSHSLSRKPLQIVYNRVGKCGSRILVEAIRLLSERHRKFELHVTDPRAPEAIDISEQVKVARKVGNFTKPTLYVQHVHHIDFMKYLHWAPVQINLIRDPLERMIAQYYYRRFGDVKSPHAIREFDDQTRNMTFDECVLQSNPECLADSRFAFYIIPYFCGQMPYCRTLSRQALETAKINLVTRYLVVGHLKNTKLLLFVLETFLPSIFKGLSYAWKFESKKNESQTSYKKPPSAEVVRIMRERMALEYEFYHFSQEHFSFVYGLALQKNITDSAKEKPLARSTLQQGPTTNKNIRL